MATPINPYTAGLDGYKRWKDELRARYLEINNGNHVLADRMFALDVIDTEYFVKIGTTKAAMDRFKDRGPAKDRGDVTTFKDVVRSHRASLATLGMSDIVRYHIERICNAAEELAETEE